MNEAFLFWSQAHQMSDLEVKKGTILYMKQIIVNAPIGKIAVSYEDEFVTEVKQVASQKIREAGYNIDIIRKYVSELSD